MSGPSEASPRKRRVSGACEQAMILYLDTSSLIKLYVEEEGSEDVRAEVAVAEVVATSLLSYPETRAALARLRRERSLTPAEHRRARAAFEQDWERFLVVQVTEAICRAAGALAEAHGLRAYDSVHLSTFRTLHLHGGSHVRFSSFDRRLNQAAAAESRRARHRKP
jgi:predicted nucleic acid-binding protein